MPLKILVLLCLLLRYSPQAQKTSVPFETLYQWELQYEGPCSNDEGDPGGFTCWGISHIDYNQWRSQQHLPLQSVSYASLNEIRSIYLNEYWLQTGCYKLPFELAAECFDWQVNSGRGVTTLQSLIETKQTGTVSDSDVLTVLQRVSRDGGIHRLLEEYIKKREQFYYSFAARGESQFLYGWLNRNNDLRAKLEQ